MQLPDYDTKQFFDEMVDENNHIRKGYKIFFSTMSKLGIPEMIRRQQAAERSFLNMGITFNVYQDGADTERIFPFDVVPRIIESQEWKILEKGLQQRIQALNFFLRDIYHDQKIIKDKIIPEDIIKSNPVIGDVVRITG